MVMNKQVSEYATKENPYNTDRKMLIKRPSENRTTSSTKKRE